jgi:PAS domain-containing protein
MTTSEATLRTIIDALPEPTFAINYKNGRILECNKAAETWATKFSCDRLVGNWVWRFFLGNVHSAEKLIRQATEGASVAVRRGEWSGKLLLKTVGGLTTEVTVLLRSGKTKEGVLIIATIVAGYDRSPLKVVRLNTTQQPVQTLALLYRVLDSLPCYLFVKDRDLRFTFVNRKLSNLLQCEPDNLIGKTDQDYYLPAFKEKYFEDDMRCLHGGQIIQAQEHLALKSKAVRTVATIKVPILSNSGVVEGIIGMALDMQEMTG